MTKPEKTIIKKETLWSKAVTKFLRDKFGILGFLVVAVYGVVALGVTFELWGTEWDELLTEEALAPSSTYWFGTNWNGQDVFERVIYSTKTAFEVGISVSLSATFIAAILGCLAGFFSGKWFDELVLLIMGCLDCIPFYLFVAAVAFALSENPYAMHIAMISTLWTSTARLVRGEVIRIKNLEFVEAAKAIGVPKFRIIFRHILPNTFHIQLVQATITFVAAIKSEVILSFLGLGVKDGVSWGLMLAESTQEVIAGVYRDFVAASLFMFVLVMAFNVFSDSLQDALDPKKVS